MFNPQQSENHTSLRSPALAAFFWSWLAPWIRLLVTIGRSRSLRLILMLLIVPVLWILLVSLLTRSLVWRCLLRRRLLELTALFVLPLYVLGSDRAPLCRRKLSRRCLRLRLMLLLPSNRRKSWVHFRVIDSPGEVLLVNSREGSTSVLIDGVPPGV